MLQNTPVILLFMCCTCYLLQNTPVILLFMCCTCYTPVILCRCQVVFGYLYGIFIFRDSIGLMGILGSGIICVGVAAVSWPAKAPPELPGSDASNPAPSDWAEGSKQSTPVGNDASREPPTSLDIQSRR